MKADLIVARLEGVAQFKRAFADIRREDDIRRGVTDVDDGR